MSSTDISAKTSPKSSVSLGGGDGLNNYTRRRKTNRSSSKTDPSGYAHRTAIPSSRRFTPKLTGGHISLAIKQAIEDLATHPNITRRRSLTMSDIPIAKKRLQYQGDEKKASKKITSEHPGRIVYQQLLLNVWRKTKEQVISNREIIKALQSQVDQLQLQKSTLQTLRDSECKRREEAIMEKGNLQSQLDQLFKNNKILIAEMTTMETQLEEAAETITKLNVDKEKIRKHLQASIENTLALEKQLERERMQLKKAHDDNCSLIEQLQLKDEELVEQGEKIRELQELVLKSEESLSNTLINYQTQELKLNEAEEKLAFMTETNMELEENLASLRKEEEDRMNTMQDLRISLEEAKEVQNKLEADKHKLKLKLAKARETIKANEKNSLWTITRELVGRSISGLNTFASTLLPAYQPAVSTSTSTTLLPADL